MVASVSAVTDRFSRTDYRAEGEEGRESGVERQGGRESVRGGREEAGRVISTAAGREGTRRCGGRDLKELPSLYSFSQSCY